MKKNIICFFIISTLVLSCTQNTKKVSEFTLPEIAVKSSDFERVLDGKEIKLFTLSNDNGMVVQVTNYGARFVTILLPGKDGEYLDVTLGYPDIDGYINDRMNLGSVVGRYANRIARGTFELDGVSYQLEINNKENTLHSGSSNYAKVVWDAVQRGDSIIMHYVSPDMHGGFPGELSITLVYVLTENNEIEMIYEAETSKKTVLNLINHSYFNMAGEGNGEITDHYIQVNGDYITTAYDDLIPTGDFLPVENTAFDLRDEVRIGKMINDDHEQIKNGNGYDHNWVLNKEKEGELTFAVSLRDTSSGMGLKIYTTEPGLQVYSGNFMDGSVTGKAGIPYNFRYGVALEAQHFPDSPNQASFPSTILEPGEKYFQKTVMEFIF